MSGAGGGLGAVGSGRNPGGSDMSGAGGPVVGLQGLETASERWAPGETPEDRT